MPINLLLTSVRLYVPKNFHSQMDFSTKPAGSQNEECLIIDPLTGKLHLCSTVPDAHDFEESHGPSVTAR